MSVTAIAGRRKRRHRPHAHPAIRPMATNTSANTTPSGSTRPDTRR